MRDSAGAIARDLVAEVGRGPAIGYILGRLVGASTWGRAWRTLQLAVAVLFA